MPSGVTTRTMKSPGYFRATCVALLCFASVLQAAVIEPSRSIPWQGHSGVTGGIPQRTSVRDCVHDAYAGKGTFYRNLTQDDKPAIVACLNSLAAQQVAYLPAGNYRLNSSLDLSGKDHITLRGAGPAQTKLHFYGSSAQGYITIIGAGTFDPPNHTATWTAGYSQGSTVVTLSTVANLTVGSILALDQVDDNTSLVWATGNENTAQFTRDNRTRHLTQFVSVTAINSATREVTISPALYTTYAPGQSPGAYWWARSVTGVGLEELAIDPSQDASPPDYNITISYAHNIWLKNIESHLARRAHVHTFRTKSIELRDSYLHHARAYASGSYGTEFWHTSCALVENTIFDTLVAPLLLAAGSSGNVFGYNYVARTRYDPSSTWLSQSAAIHAAHGFMNLFEGNVTPNIYLDNTWGSSSHTTVFRNVLNGWQADRSVNTFPIVFEAHSRYNNVVGNVLGQRDYHQTYEAYDTPYRGTTAIYVLGYWGTDRSNLTNYDATVYRSLLRHMNFDYASGTVKYCNRDGGPGCQGGDASTRLPDSLYLASKPAWYGTCTWPPVEPTGPTVHRLPAQWRYEGASCPVGRTPNPPRHLRPSRP